GYSVLAGSALVDGVYLLLMSDHLFDPEIARRLAASEHSADLILAVDSDLAGEFIDLADATKVEVAEDGGILAIGKDLTHYNAVDTGVFLAGPGLAAAIEADIAEGGPGSISAGVQRLAKAGQARTMNIGTARWIDVDDGRMLELAERLLASEGVTGNAA
ncbi:MAG: NTP transferase domain-containing protein, partial [Croceibacterium sp.]